MTHPICDECETVALCLKHGCIPKIVCLDSGSKKILTAYEHGECLTNAQLCDRTGMRLKDVAAWVAQLRKKGYLRRSSPERTVPVVHAKILTRRERQKRLGAFATVQEAIATQPVWVFSLGEADD